MGNFLIVSKIDTLEQHMQLVKEYQVSLELNDFFVPQLLDDKKKLEDTMNMYRKFGIPKNSTMHGSFLDLAIFSSDEKIRKVSKAWETRKVFVWQML